MQSARRWMRGVFLIACVLVAVDVRASTYVVLSLVGNQVTIVNAVRGTGSTLDHNRYETLPVDDASFDDAAIVAAEAALRKIHPDSAYRLLRINDPRFYALQTKWLDSGAVDIAELLALLQGQIGEEEGTRIVLITSFRAEPMLAITGGHKGSGKVAGLGFYINRFDWLRRSDTQERGRGYLGVFANFRILLINPATRTIEGNETATVGTTRAAARAEDMDPWNALSASAKYATLQGLVRTEITRLVPLLLATEKQQ